MKNNEIKTPKIRFIFIFHVIIVIISVRFDIAEFVYSTMYVYIVQNILLLMEIIKQNKI